MRRLAALLVLAGLTACGGGGGGTASAPPPTSGLPTPDVSTIAAADPGSLLPEGWQQGAVMQIFVRSYQDSDGNGSGDLRGLASRLDYLQDLGVKALWLMPVTRSQDRDHGYAVADYRDIEADYGSLADLDELLRQAHARGIGVMLDYVINHSAATNPVFVNSRDSVANAYRDWYVWQAAAPSGWNVFGGNPWRIAASGAYYAPFWDQMPDWNLGHPAVAAYHRSNLRFWLNRGVDGLRFDAVGLLFENGPTAWENQPQNYTLLADLRGVVDGYARRTMVCEAPGDPRGFALACGSAFAFDLNASLIAAARGDAAAIARVADYFKSAPPSMSTFLSNHDAFAGQRVWDQLGGDLAQMKLAAASYLLLPGRPFIYYGEEIGLAGAATIADDGKLRTPMSWSADAARAGFTTGTPYRALSANVATNNVAAQSADADSLHAFYKAMLALRNARPSIARGGYEAAFASGSLMGFQRVLGAERTVVLVNYGASAATAAVSGLPARAGLTSAYPSGGALVATADAAGNATVNVGARSVRVLAVAP
ncbi:MAG TPA: alpha-amylase family glycosyl hydrolase [Burkholderiaceae bacterium]|nr:alpha-amylase family glycosyl hydrolase [Burkholderiaceae bacterium]